MDYKPNPDYLTQYQSDMERQAIEQAQNFLRRYGILPPAGTPPPMANQNNGDLVTIPVTSMEHAENAPVDAFRTFIYPNFQSNEIYVKKIDGDGKPMTTIYLPKGKEMEKSFEDLMKKVLATMSYVDEQMKSINEKMDKWDSKKKESVE